MPSSERCRQIIVSVAHVRSQEFFFLPFYFEIIVDSWKLIERGPVNPSPNFFPLNNILHNCSILSKPGNGYCTIHRPYSDLNSDLN